MIESLLFIAGGLVALYFGAEWLVMGAARIARSFGVSPIIIGLTVVAFGTSTPELVVSLSAALGGSSDISIGNIVGSNIANIGLILGLAGLIYPISVHIGLLRREIPIMIGISLIVLLQMLNGDVSRVDGLTLVFAFAGFMALMLYLTLRDMRSGQLATDSAEADGGEVVLIQPSERLREVGRIILGLVLLVIGAQLLVDGAVNIAREIGVSEAIIGVTLVAVGTSLPELATSTIAAFRRQCDIAIGNVVGSNIFNVLFILGITAIVRPIGVNQQFINLDNWVMLGFAVLLLPFTLNRRLGRREAVAFLVLYFAFVVYTFGIRE